MKSEFSFDVKSFNGMEFYWKNAFEVQTAVNEKMHSLIIAVVHLLHTIHDFFRCYFFPFIELNGKFIV